MDSKALRPEFFSNLPTIVKEKQASAKTLSDDERFLYSLSQTPGWRIVSEYAQGLLRDLETVTDSAMAQGLSFEEIGRNAIVASLAKGVIIKLLQRVDDAKEAAERPDGTAK